MKDGDKIRSVVQTNYGDFSFQNVIILNMDVYLMLKCS